MASFNKVIIMGNISNEVELKQTQSGTSVCSFNVAVNRYSKDPTEKKVDFLTVVAWQQKAEFVSKYFKKGQAIIVCGQIQTRSYQDKQGNKRTAVEVVADEVSFVGNKESATEAKSEAPAQPYIPAAYSTQNNQNFEEIPGDETLPF